MKLTIIPAAAIAAALATTAFAQSQSTAPDAGQGVTAEAGMTGPGKMNHGQIISDLRNGTNMPEEWSVDIAALEEGATVEIVKLSELRGEAGENSNALDQALADSTGAAESARTAIDANAALKAALEAEDFDSSDVVAVRVDGTSQVTLIVDDAA